MDQTIPIYQTSISMPAIIIWIVLFKWVGLVKAIFGPHEQKQHRDSGVLLEQQHRSQARKDFRQTQMSFMIIITMIKLPCFPILIFFDIEQPFMLSYFFSVEPSFYTLLQEFFTEDSSSLNDPQLHKIMAALRGEDHKVKPQIAFAALKKAFACFDATKCEVRLLRELIILDKLVEESIYCEQISKATIFALDSNRYSAQKSLNESAFRMLKLYWKIIKDKSLIINNHDHIFKEKRSQRKHYLQRLKPSVILNQISTLQSFFITVFELIYSFETPEKPKEQQWKKGEIAQYVILHLLYKLLGLYNCQFMAQKYLIHKISQLSGAQILRLKIYIMKFKQHCSKFINFIKGHQNIKGFELIHYEDIKIEMNEKLNKFIDEYLQSLENENANLMMKTLPFNMGKIVVQKKPMSSMGKSAFNPRLCLKAEATNGNKDKGEGNAFSNWHNSFSHQFPQKEIMTVDLILQLKIQEHLSKDHEFNESSSIKQQYLSRCSYDNRSTNVTSNYQVHYLARKQYPQSPLPKIDFGNIYSKFTDKWNHF